MTPQIPNRAAPVRRVSTRTWMRLSTVPLSVLVAASVGPSAFADKGSYYGQQPAHSWAGSQPNQAGQHNGPKTDPKNDPKDGPQAGPAATGQPGPADADDANEDAFEGTLVTEPVNVETAKALKATPQPITAYEMPFPCGEVWIGGTRRNHSPSVRSVDFNRAGGDQGAPVVSSADGVVTTAVTGKKKPSYGQHVIVNHGNNESTMYAHLDSVDVVVGQEVSQGDLLGTVGNTGNSFGSHLHYEQRNGANVVDSWFHGARFKMPASMASENCGDDTPAGPPVPLAGNILGTAPAELMFFERGDAGTFVIKRPGRTDKKLPFGTAKDQPIVGDWDGNGRVNPGVRTSATKTFALRARGKVVTHTFGKKGDVPVAGNWDGLDGWEIGVRRANKFVLRSANDSRTKVILGDANDLPVTGDWDGDGVTDLGVYDQASATFTLRWTDATGAVFTSTVVFGKPTDLPVTGDWDGDGITELGVWSPDAGTFSPRLGQSVTAGRAKVSRTRVTGRFAG